MRPTVFFRSASWSEVLFFETVQLGWLLPLIVGICLWRRGRRRGRVLVAFGAIWGVLALVFVGWSIWMCSSHSVVHVETFDSAIYQGAVGTAVFAYGEKGKFSFHHAEPGAEPDKQVLWETAITNGTATLPAGRIDGVQARFAVTNAAGDVLGQLAVYMKTREGIMLEPGGRHEFAGGFPLTASVRMERGSEDGMYAMRVVMADTAGDHVRWFGADGHWLDASYEAVTSVGRCFVGGSLHEYWQTSFSEDIPPTFIIRPAFGDVPFDIRAEETQVSRDELLRETLERGEKWLKEDGK